MKKKLEYIDECNHKREEFFRRCNQRLQGDSWCCIAIDIQYFLLFNEVYGRDQGDKLLALYMDIFHQEEQKGDFLFEYLGNDDFVLFMKNDSQRMHHIYDRLKNLTMEHWNTIGFLPAIGVKRLSEDSCMDLECYDKATMALKRAKEASVERISVYSDADDEVKKTDQEILLHLKQAMDQGYITFYLQPQCKVSSRKIVGAEALARWIEPDGTVISPGKFIPILEKHGFISDFDKIIWEMVCRWIRSLLDRSIRPVPVSLNVSHMDILMMDVEAYLSGLCSKYEIPKELLKVEITESVFSDDYSSINTFVEKLRQSGFLILMDDFGSGYSSLNMLENIQIDVLKLDMGFMKRSMTGSRRGVTILESVINMAKMIQLPVIAEGVETEAQAMFLRSVGCRYVQGYYCYRPMQAEKFEKLLTTEDQMDYSGFVFKMNQQIHVREFLDPNTFTDNLLNNVLGAVAYYTLEGKDLNISRFNEQFYHAIGDPSMEERQVSIQHYVVEEDWPKLYRALDTAFDDIANGGTCEIRFYKSDNSIFWFRMHFFYLRKEQNKKLYFGQVEDINEQRQQSMQFFEVLHEQSDVSMMINLNQKKIQYVTNANMLSQIGLPAMELDLSIERTADARIPDPEDRKRFIEFFNLERLKSAYHKAKYHETITVKFRLKEKTEEVEFSTYSIRHSKDQDWIVYIFAKRKHMI